MYLLTLGDTAIQALAAGDTFEWHSELLTIRSVSSKFAITRNVRDTDTCVVVVDTPARGMRALYIRKDIMVPAFQWVTGDEFAAAIR